jgi:membrane protease YdiL (CAAX protease family)
MTLFPVLLLSISMSHIPNTMLMPYWYRAAIVARFALAGELLFRAVVIEHGEMVLPRGGKWLAAALSLAAFIAANWFSWNPVESLTAFYAGIMLTLLYLWRRNLWVNAIAGAIGLGAGYLLN